MEEVRENKMGTQPIGDLLFKMSLPIMISMLVQALYNIVDSIFVAKISEDALTAVSLAFPVQNLMIALGAGTGVGINALLSKSLGEKNFKQANSAANNGIFLCLVNFAIFVVFGAFFTGIFYRSQTSSKIIIEYGDQYLTVISLLSIGLFCQMTMEKLLQATGKTILDPCFIFGVGFFPKWGVTGAAVATCIGQFTAAAFGLFFNMKFNKEITINLVKYRPQAKIIKKIYAVGLPSIIMQSISSIMTYGMNKILIGFSNTAAAVFGVYFKLQSFVFMPVFGLNNGLIPIVAYNYGARKKKRITGAIKYAMIYSVSIMIVGTIIMQIFPAQLLKLFDASDNMLSIGVTALRIISTHFFFAGFDIIIISSLQALGKGLSSMLVSFTRQLVVLLPVAYLLSLTGKLDAIWWAFPIAEVFSIMASLFFLRRAYNAEIKPMAD